MSRLRMIPLFLVALAVSAGVSRGEPTSTSVVKELNNPCGIAIQPETGVVFVADSGAARIVKIVDGKAVPVITDFPLDEYGKGPTYKIGPLGMAFLDKKTLVVGGGGLKDGEELLRVYELPEGDEPIKADAMVSSFKLEAMGEEVKGEGNFYGVAVTKAGIFVTANGDDTKGWIAKADLMGTKVGPFARSIASKEQVEVDAPVAITTTPKGNIAVGQMGEITVPNDALLTYYNPETGKKLSNYETGLSDITGLAYSPGDNTQLYAIDFSWHDTAQGGLFQVIRELKDDKPGIKCVKLLPLDKPTALAFAPDGTLYVTVIGSGEGNTGELLKIEQLQMP